MLQAQQNQNPFFGMDISETTFPVNNFTVTPDPEPSYCLCGQTYNPDIFMIQCDSCKDWFHCTCCNFREWQVIEIDKYHCPRCSLIIGPSIPKPILNSHRHDYWDPNAANKPVQTGTPAFIKELLTRHFTPADDILIKMYGQDLTEEYLSTKGFNNPIVISKKDGLDMIMPPDNFTYIDVLKLVGDDKEIDVIDVCRQSNVKMTLREFVEYVISPSKNRIFNVLSLEFSNTGMTHIIEPPLIARKMDWANCIWPESYENKPQVQKYCLMSVKDSYTDFHIDFGGTSVWYHVLRGEKIFFFVKPTPANLTLYSQWMTSTNQSETFFGDQVDQCFKCHLTQGQTMLIPTGWIHAVYTPVDSLVFGGNFLHSLNINMQLTCYEIERKIKTEKKFMYPSFITINFFAATSLLEQIIKINLSPGAKAPDNLLAGLKALQQSIKLWNSEKDFNLSVRDQLPYGINTPKLLKDIGKEIRHAEKTINHLNPPKPERESKRKRKKPVNKDFVDYSMSPKNINNFDFMPLPSPDFNSAPSYSKSNHRSLKLILPKPQNYSYDRTNSNDSEVMYNNQNNQPLPSMDNSHIWNVPFERPQQTVAEYKGGTVMKFRLGRNDMYHTDIVPNHLDIPVDPYGEGFENKDVYDFHDDSDKDEVLDFSLVECPSNQKKIKVKMPSKQSKKKKSHRSTNGIESLLQASLSVPDRSHHGSTSPSTSEAIAGMLSISQTWTPSKSRPYQESEDEGEEANNVHQDEDYVYPSLDNSDDEDVHIFKPRGRTKVDEPWNPKARVGPLLPKMNRPSREGTKKQAVEKVLEAAAARRTIDLSITPDKSLPIIPKRQYKRKKSKPKIELTISNPQRAGSLLMSPTIIAGPSPTKTPTAVPVTGVTTPQTSPPTPKPRKGMKTAKQRLGKILKIHKMIH